ncbi:hypothetical protein [Streptomyces mirabilis]|uniref:DUF7848 domain-containing protein n=1 Tax=Streptomyces mirabilis TaxID=68239 RepID=UPI00332CDD20
MSARTVSKGAEWTPREETAAEGAPRGIFSAVCGGDGAESPPLDDDRWRVELWALKHTGLHPAHRRFRLRVLGVWRGDPAPGNL